MDPERPKLSAGLCREALSHSGARWRGGGNSPPPIPQVRSRLVKKELRARVKSAYICAKVYLRPTSRWPMPYRYIVCHLRLEFILAESHPPLLKMKCSSKMPGIPLTHAFYVFPHMTQTQSTPMKAKSRKMADNGTPYCSQKSIVGVGSMFDANTNTNSICIMGILFTDIRHDFTQIPLRNEQSNSNIHDFS